MKTKQHKLPTFQMVVQSTVDHWVGHVVFVADGFGNGRSEFLRLVIKGLGKAIHTDKHG